jgi:transketolase
MRIGNDPIPNLFERRKFEIGKGRLASPGTDITLIAAGSITANAVTAAGLLEKRGISAEVIAMPSISPVDADLIVKSVMKTGCAATLEEHYVIGGLGTIVQETLSEAYPAKVLKLGLPHGYTASGPYLELLKYYNLDAGGVADSIEMFLRKNKLRGD